MATQTERKALIGLAVVAVLAGGVRLWRAHHATMFDAHGMSGDSGGSDNGKEQYRSSEQGDAPKGGGHYRKRSKWRGAPDVPVDSTSIIDLDRASEAEIEALGVLKAGGARLIVANRDSFGPFGSITEVERIPYLTRSEIRKLARRVTFSGPPRPTDMLYPGRPDTVPRHRRRSP